MARGVVPDDHPLCANAARSLALSQADVALVVGSQLNWQLHFGEPPKWSAGVKFILVDASISERDASLAEIVLEGNIPKSISAMMDALVATHHGLSTDTSKSSVSRQLAEQYKDRITQLAVKAAAAKDKLAIALQRTALPLNYQTALRVIRDRIVDTKPAPIIVSEGANTMDQARYVFFFSFCPYKLSILEPYIPTTFACRMLLQPVKEPRCRLDAGIHGTMGVGPGYALAAAVAHPRRSVLAIEGDSAFGFSAMEVETACRYRLPIAFVVFNNGGIYGGDRRERALRGLAERGMKSAGFEEDPAPTAFVPGSRYELMGEAFGGTGVRVETAEELDAAICRALSLNSSSTDGGGSSRSGGAMVINVRIDPMAGVESGNVHSFNAPKK